jgi:NAD(P)-dependent dehydrogenase (short-subunit alcohol dehydrogenase family)
VTVLGGSRHVGIDLPGLDRVALVTGAAGIGIGQAVARRLAAAGGAVVVTDAHEERTNFVAAAIAADFPASRVLGIPLDVASPDAVEAAVEEVDRTFGPIRIVVNNAVCNHRGAIDELSIEHWHHMLDVNISGPWYLTRFVMPMMRAAGGGVFVNVGSYAGDIGVEGAHGIGKSALNVLARVIAREGGPSGIRAVTVTTGFVADSKFAQDHPEMATTSYTQGVLGSHATAAEVAEAVAFLASDHAAHITGEVLNVGNGAYFRT